MTIDKGNVHAMCNYGFMLMNGLGIEVDYKEAMKYYKIAIDKGNKVAMFSYAFMLKNGLRVEVDYKEGIKYFKLAIDKGVMSAFNHCTCMLEDGHSDLLPHYLVERILNSSIKKKNSH